MVVAEHFDHVVLRLIVRDAQLPHGAAVLVLLSLREAEATEKVADHLVFCGGFLYNKIQTLFGINDPEDDMGYQEFDELGEKIQHIIDSAVDEKNYQK